jgi:3-oxoadipate enol-lactonase
MTTIQSGDAQISYEILGDGPPVVLLHPFPANHELWLRAAQQLTSRYRVILPDLRGHGDSGVGEGPATMPKHAADISRVLDDAKLGRAAFAGVSIGGYVLFEFWRRNRDRISALALIDTKAAPDTPEGRAGRLRSAADVLERGVEPFIENMLPKLLGETTRHARPDLVESAQKMMLKMSPDDISLVLKGMAERPDSITTLKTLGVPTLILVGDEDTLTPVADAELMKQNISGSQMKVIPKAGHYAVWEQPEETGKVLRQFFDTVHAA